MHISISDVFPSTAATIVLTAIATAVAAIMAEFVIDGVRQWLRGLAKLTREEVQNLTNDEVESSALRLTQAEEEQVRLKAVRILGRFWFRPDAVASLDAASVDSNQPSEVRALCTSTLGRMRRRLDREQRRVLPKA